MLIINSEQNESILNSINEDFFIDNILFIDDLNEINKQLVCYITRLCNGVLFKDKIMLDIPYIIFTSNEEVVERLNMMFINDIYNEKPSIDYFIEHKYLPISNKGVSALVRFVNKENESDDLKLMKTFKYLGYVEEKNLEEYIDEEWKPKLDKDISVWLPTPKLINSIYAELPILGNSLKILITDMKPYIQNRDYEKNIDVIKETLIQAMNIIDYHIKEYIRGSE